MIFLSGVLCPEAEELGRTHNVGAMVTPAIGPLRVMNYPHHAIDNECFTRPIDPGSKNEARWLRCLDKFVPQQERCLFASVPDCAYHEDKPEDEPAKRTLELFYHYRQEVAGRGYPVAFCLQNGSEAPGMVPWGDIDAVFIGGDTRWKLSHHAMYLVWEAKNRGLHAHMGRANSLKRFRRAVEMQVDSTDGTFLRWPKANAPRLRVMLDGLDDDPQLALA